MLLGRVRLEDLQCRFPGQHKGGGHARVDCHPDIGHQPITDHDAVGRVQFQPFQGSFEHERVWFPRVLLAANPGAPFDRPDNRGGVRFAASTREWAKAVGVGGDEPGPSVRADRVEGNLQLAVVEGAVVAGDNDIDLCRVLRHSDTSGRERLLERRFTNWEDGSGGVVAQQPARHRVDGVEHLFAACRDAQPGEFGNVVVRRAGRVVGEKEDLAVKRDQRLDQTLGPWQQVIAKVDRTVEIEDIAGSKPIGPATPWHRL